MSSIAGILQAPGARFEVSDDFEFANDFCRERGWTDGLPVVPPTEARVARMLRHYDRPWDEPVAMVPPRNGAATPLRLAANAVMAGCIAEYFPLVVLAIEALCEERFNLYAVQTTSHSCAPLIMVNGPVARELGMNSGVGALGSGTRSNASIGRAVRLALVNIGGAIPGIGDMATYGNPAKFSYCAAENEAANPWQPLHVERGMPSAASAVTVMAAEAPHNVNDPESTTAEGILGMIASSVATFGANNAFHPAAEAVVLLSPEHAAAIAAAGYTKAAVKQYLYEHTRLPLAQLSKENIEHRLQLRFPGRYTNAQAGEMVPIAQSADKFVLIVMGGAGRHSAYLPSFGNTVSVTRMLRRADGEPVRSIAGFGTR